MTRPGPPPGTPPGTRRRAPDVRSHRAAPGRSAQVRAGAPDRFTPPYDMVELRAPNGPLRARPDPGQDRRPMTFAARGGGRPRRGRARRFVRSYGWRAYAVPVLSVLTLLCVVDVANGSAAGMPLPIGADSGSDGERAAAPAPSQAPPPAASAPAAPAPRPTSTGIFVDDPGGGTARAVPPTALPAGGPYTTSGGNRFDVVPGSSPVSGPGPVRRYLVEVEAGIPEDGTTFAAAVQRTLADPRSWGTKGAMAFQRVDSGPVDFRVTLTSSLTVRRLCGYVLPYETSCYNGELGRAVINDARWVRGAVAYSGNLASYRQYVINHEVGHALGNAHQPCRKAGTLASVMMQQTLGLATAGVGDCRANPWPYP